jgi:hypothetical protein
MWKGVGRRTGSATFTSQSKTVTQAFYWFPLDSEFANRPNSPLETSLRRRPQRNPLAAMPAPNPTTLVTIANGHDLQEASRSPWRPQASRSSFPTS